MNDDEREQLRRQLNELFAGERRVDRAIVYSLCMLYDQTDEAIALAETYARKRGVEISGETYE